MNGFTGRAPRRPVFEARGPGDRGACAAELSSGKAGLFRHGRMAAAAVLLAVALSGAARSADECGPAEAGQPLTCSPATYDPSSGGNIFYGPDDAFEDDFEIRLAGDLSVRYDRNAPGGDVLIRRLGAAASSAEARSRYGAVVIAPGGPEYSADIRVSSSADIATNARGILVYHEGASGAVRLDVQGGRIVTTESRTGYAVVASHTGSGNVVTTVEGAVIEAGGENAIGVIAEHFGTGQVDARVWGGRIAATGQARGDGFRAQRAGTGDMTVVAEDAAIEAAGNSALGVFAGHWGSGNIDARLRGSTIAATGQTRSDGLWVYHAGPGDIAVAVEGAAIEAGGDAATGILATHLAVGAVAVDVRDGWIEATGGRVDGIFAQAAGGGIDIAAEDVAIGIEGTEYSNGIAALDRAGSGDVSIALRNADIEVRGGEYLSGIYVEQSAGDPDAAAQRAGDSRVEVRGGGIRTAGTASGAIQIHHEHGGNISIDVRDAAIEATGERALGIEARHPGSAGAVHVRVEGGTLNVEGPGGHGISVGSFDEETGAVRAAGSGADGYRRQHVSVNGRVRGGGGAGVRLVGGGRVAIGPRGRVGAASGVAVLAEGAGAALRVEAQLDGRAMDDAVAGAIRNDGGRTTIAVNGVVLHDGAAGATGLRAPNGAWDVTLAASESVAGRAFSTSDFAAGYAPRAAVYEALPGFMLRLDGEGTAGTRLRNPGSLAWVRITGGGGSREAAGASVGAAWDFNRFEVGAGVDLALSREGGVTGSVSLRHVRGAADVAAPTGGGTIEAAGFGASFGASWENAEGYHAGGRVSVIRYEADLRSDGRGRLTEGAAATVRSLRVEAGRRLSFGEGLRLTPRAWLAGSDVALDGFRDAVGSRVSPEDAARVAAGAGLAAETEHAWDNGARALVLRGHLGVERALGRTETAVDVSGGRLGAGFARTRALLGVGGVYRGNRWSLGGEVSVSGPGSNDSEYTAALRIGTQF